jgi:hypothetical protein
MPNGFSARRSVPQTRPLQATRVWGLVEVIHRCADFIIILFGLRPTVVGYDPVSIGSGLCAVVSRYSLSEMRRSDGCVLDIGRFYDRAPYCDYGLGGFSHCAVEKGMPDRSGGQSLP